MHKLLILSLLLGCSLTAKIPLKKGKLSIESLQNYKEKLENGFFNNLDINEDELPLNDY
jgi:hypothetical protein